MNQKLWEGEGHYPAQNPDTPINYLHHFMSIYFATCKSKGKTQSGKMWQNTQKHKTESTTKGWGWTKLNLHYWQLHMNSIILWAGKSFMKRRTGRMKGKSLHGKMTVMIFSAWYFLLIRVISNLSGLKKQLPSPTPQIKKKKNKSSFNLLMQVLSTLPEWSTLHPSFCSGTHTCANIQYYLHPLEEEEEFLTI